MKFKLSRYFQQDVREDTAVFIVKVKLTQRVVQINDCRESHIR